MEETMEEKNDTHSSTYDKSNTLSELLVISAMVEICY